jgi:hypothetical protein
MFFFLGDGGNIRVLSPLIPYATLSLLFLFLTLLRFGSIFKYYDFMLAELYTSFSSGDLCFDHCVI